MTDHRDSGAKPTSKPTSSLARNLLAKTFDHLAEMDNDPSAKRRAERLRQAAQQREK